MKRHLQVLVLVFVLSAGDVGVLLAAPVTVNGDPFTLVATGPGTAQLFGLTADSVGRIYAGNNANNTTGIPLQLFDPALFSGSPVPLQNFGPAVGDADGLAYGGGFIYVPDQNEGLQRVAVPTGTSTLFVAGVAINPTGSPVVYRPSDGHVFVGAGSSVPGAPGAKRIDEYNPTGAFVQSFTTTAETETMTFDSASGLIYYAAFDTEVRSFNPLTGADLHVGNSSGFIDGGLTLDARSGLLFVGTANGANSGLVETIDPTTGERRLFASGFNGSLGILREPISGDLYFLESNQLYRLPSAFVPPPTPAVVQLSNISGRTFGQLNEKVSICGFIIQGGTGKKVIARGIGPSLKIGNTPIAGRMLDPMIELHDGSGAQISMNDDWRTTQATEIQQTGLAPTDNRESAIVATLPPGAYTAILRGANNSSGIGLVEVYELQFFDGLFANVSVRGEVLTDDNVLINGLILRGALPKRILFRALGPELRARNITGELQDPMLAVYNENGVALGNNDNWRQSSDALAIQASGLAPTDDRESAVLLTLSAGNYTAIVSGVNRTTGVALAEAYLLANLPSARGER